jgi:iron complex transport system substrate-binding protein
MVVLGPNVMDIVYRLGVRSHAVGIDCSNASLGGVLGDYTPAQVSLWGLNNSMCVLAFPQLSAESLLAKRPQLLIASSVVPVASLESFSATYRVPAVILSPSTLGGVVYDTQVVAKIFGIGAAASALVTQLQQSLASAQQFLTNLTNAGTPLRTVFVTYYAVPAGSPSAGYYTFGPGTFGQSLLELSGGVNVASNATTSTPEFTGSQVLAANPAEIVYGTGFGVALPQYQQGPDWSSFSAVRHGNATAVDVTLMTEVDPTMVLSLHLFRHLLYPSLVGP